MSTQEDMLDVIKAGTVMRAAQNVYFKQRTREALIISKNAEKEFDEKASTVMLKVKGENNASHS